ncbi:MAG: DUF362 domain-containing protein [Pseudomonadota bacterium]
MSDVYFTSSRSHGNKSLLRKFASLIDKCSIDYKPGDIVAIKLHMGHPGGTSFIRPMFARTLVDKIKSKNSKPYLTDTSTLYTGQRDNPIDFIESAIRNGFSFSTVNAPIIIADGIESKDIVKEEINLNHFKEINVASAVQHSSSLAVISHFKLHMVTGFGGAIKNVGMGLGSRASKQRMHASVQPKLFNEDACIACGICTNSCPENAVKLKNKLPEFDFTKCVGCAECIAHCPEHALEIQWNENPEVVGEKIAETAYAVLNKKKNKKVFYNFLIDITPDCDCMHWSDNPIVSNIGILASNDPVAIDMASCNLVNAQKGLESSRLRSAFNENEDKISAIYPYSNWIKQLEYAEKIGLGSMKYNLVNIDN